MSHTSFSLTVLGHGVGVALDALLRAAAHRVTGLCVQSATPDKQLFQGLR